MQQGAQRPVVFGHADHVQTLATGDARIRIGQYIQHAAAGAHFLHIAFEFFEQGVVGCHRHHRHLVRDQGQRPVL